MADAEYKRLGCAADGCAKERSSLGLCSAHYRRLKRKGTFADASAKLCIHCGAQFNPAQSNAVYCKKSCKVSAWRIANPSRAIAHKTTERKKNAPLPYSKVYTGKCVRCCEAYVLRKPSEGFCGQACKKSLRAWQSAMTARIKHEHRGDVLSCLQCSSEFCPLYGYSHAKLCTVCAKARAKRSSRVSRLTGKMRKRAQTVESVDPLKVFERDRWRCQLCRKVTPKKLRGTYADLAPELDHILPLSLGGEHSYRNTQCLCRACNGAKSNKPLGQMLLIG